MESQKYTTVPLKVDVRNRLAEFCGKLRPYSEAVEELLNIREQYFKCKKTCANFNKEPRNTKNIK